LPSSADALSILPPWQKEKYEYDLVVIGAGASGLFSAGTSSSVGFKTLLIERAQHHRADGTIQFNVGGDCTNAACVPSKSIRSIAKIAAATRIGNSMTSETSGQNANNSNKWLKLARTQADDAVGRVRAREDPSRIGDVPNLDLEFVRDCQFISDHKMKLMCYDNSTWILDEQENVTTVANESIIGERIVSSKKFIIATGASPILPKDLTKAATDAGVPYLTYRDLLRPSSSDILLNNTSTRNIVIVGGGATACELGQSLSRLAGNDLNLSIVAPAILSTEDVKLQDSAIKILSNDNCKLYIGRRAVDIVEGGEAIPHLVLDDNSTIPVDCIIFCTGRSPESSLKSLHLDKAGVAWTAEKGVTVNSYLKSETSKHVYAAGDCASAVDPRDRRAIHAGWLGFNAVRNALLPWFLRSHATHQFVPRVTYLDPEIASAGMSAAECTRRFGVDGYDSILVPEDGSDRAD
ncbi:hypothetical protein ACHAXR_001419, partial [Thalassiosira sp. AJA248-18]